MSKYYKFRDEFFSKLLEGKNIKLDDESDDDELDPKKVGDILQKFQRENTILKLKVKLISEIYTGEIYRLNKKMEKVYEILKLPITEDEDFRRKEGQLESYKLILEKIEEFDNKKE
jgi:hypothetical protein